MSPTSVTTFSFQVGIALKDSLSVVENTRTQAWAPKNIQIDYKYKEIHNNQQTLKKKEAAYIMYFKYEGFFKFLP